MLQLLRIVKRKNIIYGSGSRSDLIYVAKKEMGYGGAQMASENRDKLNISAVQDADAVKASFGSMAM